MTWDLIFLFTLNRSLKWWKSNFKIYHFLFPQSTSHIHFILLYLKDDYSGGGKLHKFWFGAIKRKLQLNLGHLPREGGSPLEDNVENKTGFTLNTMKYEFKLWSTAPTPEQQRLVTTLPIIWFSMNFYFIFLEFISFYNSPSKELMRGI